MSRGGFHGRQLRSGGGGFDKPPQPGAGDTLDHVLYPPNRPFYYVAPAVIAATPLALGPRVPSTALHLCQHSHPCPAHEALAQTDQSVLWFYEASARGGKKGVASIGEICQCIDQLSETTPRLALDDDDVLKRLRGEIGDPMFGNFVGRLPPELRIFAPTRAASSAPEMRVLQKIKQHRRRRLEKPQRRGGVVLPPSNGSKDGLVSSSKGRSSSGGSPLQSKKAKQRPTSQFVDDSAKEDDGGEEEMGRKRPRDADEGDSGSDAADEEGETSASCGGDNDDDDDAVDDASGGGGSGDELTF